MKPSLQKINPPANCGPIRGRYADTLQNQNFLREIQTQIDDFGPYIQNNLEADLREIQQSADPQFIFKSFIKFVRIEPRAPTGNDYLNFAQVSVFNEAGANISQGKQATSSSVYMAISGPEKAVNGRGELVTNFFASGSLSGSVDPAPWWQVDLGNPSVVSRVVVRNRNDCCQGRLARYDLLLLNQQREVVRRIPLTSAQQQNIEITLPTSKRELVQRKLRQLQDAEVRMQQTMKCLNLELNQRQSISSEIYNLNQMAKEKEEDVKTKHENVKASKERAELLQNPYESVSNWESWFPLGRPLERGSIPVLWFLSIVFLTLSFGLFLEVVGVNVELPGIQDSFNALLKSLDEWIDSVRSFFTGEPSRTSYNGKGSDFLGRLFASKGTTPSKNINVLRL